MMHRTRYSCVLFCVLVVLACAIPRTAAADSLKGEWGHVTPIADNNHPNLYYDQSEIDELRTMILVQQSPANLVSLYRNVIRGVMAHTAAYDEYDTENMKATITYMIEPTSPKADALRASLMSYREMWPEGLWDWYTAGGCHGCGYFVPWMFDLLQAYHPETLSPDEIADLKEWFRRSSELLKFDSRDARAVSQAGDAVAPDDTREGKTMNRFPNWFSRYTGPALAAALVSGDQADVDYYADSGWPHDLLTFRRARSAVSESANRYDLVMYMLAVYPSGANTDTYDREGFDIGTREWNTTTYAPGYDGGSYHFAQMIGVMMGAEMAYHNGMTRVFEITDVPDTTPALLRTYHKAIESRGEVDVRPDSETSHPFLWHDPQNMLGYRRYDDPIFDHLTDNLYIQCGMQCGPEMADYRLWEFFGYPRRIVWSSRPAATVDAAAER